MAFILLINSADMAIYSYSAINWNVSLINKFDILRIVRHVEIIEFSRSLSMMMRSGVPVLQAITDIADRMEDGCFKEIIINIRKKMELGSSFSDSIACFAVFPDFFVRLCRYGEENGDLEKSLSSLINYMGKMEDISSSIKRALIYPVFMAVLLLGALSAWLMYLLPKVLELFRNLNLAITLPTRILIVMSDLVRSYWFFVILVMAVSVVGLSFLRKRKALYYFDLLIMSLPVIKRVAWNRFFVIFTEQFRALSAAGISTEKSLLAISGTIHNEAIQSSIDKIRKDVSLGSSLSNAIEKQRIFPTYFSNKIKAGEESGCMDEKLLHLSEYYSKELYRVLQKIEGKIEPVFIGTIGFLFALVVLGMLFPLFDLAIKMGAV